MSWNEPRWSLADVFSGCGGLSEGFNQSERFNLVYACDNDRWANATYAANLNHTPDNRDLKLLADPAERTKWALEVRASAGSGPLVFAGGPPCQGFSSHVKTKGDRRGRNALVGIFAQLAVAVEADVVMVENVADLASNRSWDEYLALRDTLIDSGYRVRSRIINMAQLGVPQERFRTVMLAARDRKPTFPAPVKTSPSDFSTVKEWIGDLPPIGPGETNDQDPMHVTSNHRASTIEILRQVPLDGGSRPRGVGPGCLDRTYSSHGGYTDVYGRLAWSEAAPTITARCRTPSCGRFAHPEQHRGLSAREAGLLQTFPAHWNFVGPFDDRYKQIGNAVPPLAAKAFAEHIYSGMPDQDDEVGLWELGNEPIGSSFSVLIPGIRKRGGTLVR